ncbi:MAG: ATP-binding protein [Gammaproteobacteria bacterium]|nr:ATP-binding protein [Gammaproteobacteria bacterium]MDD9874725.1 ATP-binding protein [Gammaproteobacteria bacterium]
MKPKRRFFHSYTSRLALLYALIFSASTLFLFLFFYRFTASYMTEQVDNTIDNEIQSLAERYDARGLEGMAALIAARVRRQQAQATGDWIYLLTTAAFQPLVGNLSQWPRNTATDAGRIEFDLLVNPESGERRLARARVFSLPGRYRLLVGRDVKQLTEAKRRIIQALTWGSAIMLVLAFAGGFVVSRRAVRKIERINQTARSIMSGDLSRRVPLTTDHDDFDQVAENLNRMLDRIQRLMEDIRRVSDNIAHDLRTPLARLRQHLEQARRDSDPRSAHHLESSIREADSLLSTFNALLRIARIEAGQMQSGFDFMDFAALVGDVTEFYEPLAEEKQQRLETTVEFGVQSRGDRDLIFQALANVIDNAIKYAPRQSVIRVSLIRLHAEAVITIADHGPGIPAPRRERVFRRFYRLDQSRSSTGNGLGLSLVQAVVSLHNGGIELEDNHPGLKVVIKLPLIAQPESNASAAATADLQQPGRRRRGVIRG